MKLIRPNSDDMKLIYFRSKRYAEDSIKYTFEYDNFKGGDTSKKLDRITVGRLGQEGVYTVCRKNNIFFVEDMTPPQKKDEFDAVIYGKIFDIKTSKGGMMPPQVASHLISEKVDFYCFVKTSSYDTNEFSQVIPIGIMTYFDFWNDSTRIKKGEIIPTTNIINKFSNTNILTFDNAKNVIDFDTAFLNLRDRSVLGSALSDINVKFDTIIRMLSHIMAE